MDIHSFFSPVNTSSIWDYAKIALSDHIGVYKDAFPEWEQAEILLIGCPNRDQDDLFGSVERIREHLYAFSKPASRIKVADLGNINPQTSQEGLYEELSDILGYLLEAGKTVVLMGGSQDLTFGQYLAYEQDTKSLEYVHIGPRFDILDSGVITDSRSFNHRIFTYQPSHLFDFTNLGYQRYFINQDDLDELKQRNFSAVRYGVLQQHISWAEPYLRTADMVCMDVSSIRSRDIPGVVLKSPGGYSPVEACRLSRYTGLGYQVRSVNFAGYRADLDPDGQGAMLIAMMIWYFIDGYYGRWNDLPREDRANLRQYRVQLQSSIDAINFYCHMQTGRWWMEVPYPSDLGQKFPRNRLIACSQADYEMAQKDEIPERWWLTFNKLK